MPTRNKRIQVLVTPGEDAEIQVKAQEAGLSVSNWFRVRAGLKPLEKGMFFKEHNPRRKNMYIGYNDLVYDNSGEYLAPASTAHNTEDYPNTATWDGDGYWDEENEVYFTPRS